MTTLATITPEMSALKARLKSTWESGDYGVFAKYLEKGALEYPFAPAKVVDFFIEYYGPTNRAYGSLDAAGQMAMHDDLTGPWSKNNVATDGSTRVLAEYIEVVGTRA